MNEQEFVGSYCFSIYIVFGSILILRDFVSCFRNVVFSFVTCNVYDKDD